MTRYIFGNNIAALQIIFRSKFWSNRLHDIHKVWIQRESYYFIYCFQYNDALSKELNILVLLNGQKD